jgi:hypothetical protein
VWQVGTPGLVEALLDRDTESEKAGLEWKGAVLSHLHAALRPEAPCAEAEAEAARVYASWAPRVAQWLAEGPLFRGHSARVQELYL